MIVHDHERGTAIDVCDSERDVRTEDRQKLLGWFKDEVAVLERMAAGDPDMREQVAQLNDRVDALVPKECNSDGETDHAF